MNVIKPLAAACLLAAACGGNDLIGGNDDLAISQPDIAGAKLQSGSYAVTNVVKISDGCNYTLEDGTVNAIPLANTGTTLTIGRQFDSTTDPTANPTIFSFGSGPYTSATMATLTAQSQLTFTDGCTYAVNRTSQLTFVGNNDLTVDFTDNQSGFTGCTNAADFTPVDNMACTSHYTFHLKM